MKKFMMVACMVALVFGVAVVENASAYNVRIEDNYIGGDDHGYGDVIGNAGEFGVDWMDITLDGYKLTVDIKTNYVDHIGALGTKLGDLFISTDGWNPSGNPVDKYKYDNAKTGEDWEYAFDVSEKKLFDIRGGGQGNIQTTDVAYNRYTYRNGQETLVDPIGLTEIADVDGTVVENTVENYLSISFDITEMVRDLDNFQLAFHWNMTCGNDTIEGAIDPMTAPVPEPSTVLLLGLGLFGVVGLSRKRLKK